MERAALTARVRQALADGTDVVERRMFRSVGFTIGGVLRAGVGRHADHVMTARVPKAQPQEALTVPGVLPAVMHGSATTGWLFFAQGAVETDEQLLRWIGSALAAEA